MITSIEDLLSAIQFKSPTELFPDTVQRELFVTLVELVQVNCGEESGWQGQPIHLDFVTGSMTTQSVRNVLSAVKTRCRWVDIAANGIPMRSGTWLLAVTGTALTPALEAG